MNQARLTDDERLLKVLNQSVNNLTDAVERLDRTILGAEAEGNEGILPRLNRLERMVERLYWAFPFLVLGGTALGQVAAKWLGLS